jgi:hypothetical protein
MEILYQTINIRTFHDDIGINLLGHLTSGTGEENIVLILITQVGITFQVLTTSGMNMEATPALVPQIRPNNHKSHRLRHQ